MISEPTLQASKMAQGRETIMQFMTIQEPSNSILVDLKIINLHKKY